MSRIVIVDENDVVIGAKEREALLPGERYRISFLWVTNSLGEVLLAKRSQRKKKNPGVWGPAVAGTIEEGEDYDSNMVKEIKEEIGLTVSVGDLQRGPKIAVSKDDQMWFAQTYLLTLDKLAEDFVIQLEEVECVSWFSTEKIRHMIKDEPQLLTPSANQWGIFLK